MMVSRVEQRNRTVWTWCTVAFLLAAHAALLSWSALRMSVTFDEYAHLPAGVAYWKYREFSIHNLSPPLLRMLAAWPAVLAGADAPPASSYRKYEDRRRHWIYAEDFMQSNFQRYHRYFVLSRLGMIPWSCLGALIVFWWARQLYGAPGGILACAVYCLDPNMLAHASLVGTDAGLAVALLGAVYLWQRFCRAPTWANAVFASFAGSAAILCKYTALLLVPVMLAIAVWGVAINRKQWRHLLAGLCISALAVWFVVNLFHGYWKTFEPLRSFEFQSSLMSGVQKRLPGWTPVPFPRRMVMGFDTQKYEADLPDAAYMLGEQYSEARWSYYPLVLACKMPLATWAIILLTIWTLFRRRLAADEWPLIITIATYILGMIILADINLGLRYILPILPPLFILVGRVIPNATSFRDGVRAGSWVGWLLLAVLAVESLAVAPRFLTFFNAACGGAWRAQFILNDSNIGWGQELLDLRDWMKRDNVKRIGLAYFGRVDPRVYGIEWTPLMEGGHEEEYVAISSYWLTGMPHRMRISTGLSDFVNLPYYRELRAKEPVASVGRMMYIYRRADMLQAMREHEGS